jgi:type IX secretion system PorP/SprF family membrane protein
MKRVSLLLVICFTATMASAQQDPLYAQYMTNPFVLNPAYAGMTNNLNASLSYRQQWAGFDGSPVTINANGHISLFANTMGVGVMVISDKIGATSVNEVYGSYSYRIRVASDKTLAFGLQAGLINFKTQNSKLTIQDPNDPLFMGETTDIKPGLGAGILITSSNFFVGFSVPRMLRAKTDAGDSELTAYTRHAYAMGSYLFFVSDRIRFRPSLLAKIVGGAPVSVDINASMILHENYSAGVLTRNFATYGILLQAMIKNSFRLGYAMELPTNKSVGAHFSTHEITVGLRLNVLQFHSSNEVTSL